MARVHVCAECDGTGRVGFERGPATERCGGCRGVGVVFPDPGRAGRDLFDALSGADLLELGPGGAVRALAAALARLEERLESVERELARH